MNNFNWSEVRDHYGNLATFFSGERIYIKSKDIYATVIQECCDRQYLYYIPFKYVWGEILYRTDCGSIGNCRTIECEKVYD